MIVAIWGNEGSGKTTIALTFPRPLRHFDLDVGGFDRAAWRLDAAGIDSKSYPLSIQFDKLSGPEGVKAVKTEKRLSVRLTPKVVGYRELWQRIVVDYVEACQDSNIKTIVMDSATQLWTICHVAELQLKQEAQVAKSPMLPDSDLRERLQPVEFPNERMRQLIYTARSCGKILILTHYPANIYKEMPNPRTGEVTSYKSDDLKLDGFNATVKLSDIVIWTEASADGPKASVSLKAAISGLGMDAIGLMLPEPSYDGILQLIKLQKMKRGEVG